MTNKELGNLLKQLKFEKDLEKPEFICCICEKKFKGYGNNPWPICSNYDSKTKTVNECCNDCNEKYVIAARSGKDLPEWLIEKFKLKFIHQKEN